MDPATPWTVQGHIRCADELVTVWPLGHLAAGYLLYSAFSRHYRGHSPNGAETVAVVFGTQFPDLIDKPLAWTFGLLPNGRSLAHSLLVAAILLAFAWIVCQHVGTPSLAGAFGVGYVSHLATDAIPALLYGMPREWTFLFWPMLPPVDYDPSFGFRAHIAALELTPFLVLQLAMGAFTLAVWVWDGMPALRTGRMRDN